MRCKQGDLAFVVSGKDAGAVVKCLQMIGEVGQEKDVWETDKALAWNFGDFFMCPDSILRPIRDNDGQDEMLRIVGKPEKVT